MGTRFVIDFLHLAESPAFAEFSAIVHELTGIDVALYSPDFTQIRTRFSVSDNSPICQLICSTQDGADDCQRCNREHFAEVAQAGRGMSYLCHAGLIDMAIPIFHNRRLVAIISCGQIRPCPGEEGLELVLDRISHLRLSAEKVREAYLQTRYLDAQQVQVVMKLIAFFAEHLCDVGQRLLDAADGSVRHEVTQAIRYVHENFGGDISVAATAEHIGISPNYLSSLFRKTTGARFTEFVQGIRIERAKSLLEQTSWAITQIAFECGFNSISQFNRVFHKIEGCTPRKYRACVRQKYK